MKEWIKVAKPEIFRFMNLSYRPSSTIELSLSDNSFLLLIDRYEQAERAYYGKEELRNEKLTEEAKRDYEKAKRGRKKKDEIKRTEADE